MALVSDAAVQADPVEYRTHSKALADIQPLVETFREYRSALTEIAQVQELADSSEGDMRDLAHQELRTLSARRDTLLSAIKTLLVPKESERREERRAGNPRWDGRRGSRAVRGRSLPDVPQVRGAARLALGSAFRQRNRRGRIEGIDRARRGPAGLQPTQVRKRGPPRPTCARNGSERPDPHLDRDGGRATRSRRGRHPDRSEGAAD